MARHKEIRLGHSHGFDKTINNDVPGKFKDELGGKNIFEVIALASKLYSIMKEKYKKTEIVDDKKCKGGYQGCYQK